MNIDFEQKDRDVAYNNKRAVLRNHPCLKATESAMLPLASERIFAYLENYGAYTFRVRGAAKVMCHLMFAVLALTAQQIFHLIL